MEIIEFIVGAEKLTTELGEWPSFHDDEVVTILLTREAELDSAKNTSMRLGIHVRRHEQVGFGTAQYHLRMNKNILVHLVFRGIQDLAMSDFNEQNVIYSLEIAVDSKSSTPEARVSIQSSFGLEGNFRCRSIQVESIEMLPLA